MVVPRRPRISSRRANSLPVTSWVLPWLFLLFAGLALVKQLNHNILQHRIASKPSVPFLLAFIVILAAALFFCQACLPQSLAIPYIAQVRPDWLVLSFFSFGLGVYAFRHRWFTPSGYQPKGNGLLGFAIMVGVGAGYLTIACVATALIFLVLTVFVRLDARLEGRFHNVLVMHKDEAVKENRLHLLALTYSLIQPLGDIKKLS